MGGSGMPGGMMGPMDRPPLSREEFMELQERQRRRRIMQEHPERSVLFCQIANCFKCMTRCRKSEGLVSKLLIFMSRC
jgi:hypothetical protein